MTTELPKHLARQQRAIEAQIREAFKGVTREGGVSWSEADVIDDYGTDAERADARDRDYESGWEELIDEPKWVIGPGCGGFSFLDAIGFRYYMAPAMIRCLRDEGRSDVSFHLHIDSEHALDQVRLFDADQSRVVARFVEIMIAMHGYRKHRSSAKAWTEVYDSHWRSKDRGTPLEEV